jgi:hypothetical protein
MYSDMFNHGVPESVSLPISNSNKQVFYRKTTQHSVAEVLASLEEPFASKDVKWLVAATSRANRKGRVTPYADPRAYTDRLNELVTPSGWTREYTVHPVSPITRMKKDKVVQSVKVLFTCVLTISGVGAHSGSGEEWAADENAMTSAEGRASLRIMLW